jgi:hypothetical protein
MRVCGAAVGVGLCGRWDVLGRSGVQSAEQRAFSHAAVWQGLGNNKLAGKVNVNTAPTGGRCTCTGSYRRECACTSLVARMRPKAPSGRRGG